MLHPHKGIRLEALSDLVARERYTNQAALDLGERHRKVEERSVLDRVDDGFAFALDGYGMVAGADGDTPVFDCFLVDVEGLARCPLPRERERAHEAGRNPFLSLPARRK